LPWGTSTPLGDMNLTIRLGKGGPLEPRPTFHFFCLMLGSGEEGGFGRGGGNKPAYA
jgi:hypothetical protein